MSEYWLEQGESPYPHERDALKWVREWFPQHEPWRAFARFSFPAKDGRDYEIDLLVAGPTGCFLVEFKGYEGLIKGDSRNLMSWMGPRTQAFDHPGRLLKKKIDLLVEALKGTSAYKTKKGRPPFIEPLVFFHNADTLELSDGAAVGAVLKDRGIADASPIKGLRAVVLERDASWLRRLQDGERYVDAPTARALTKAINEVAYFGPRPPMVAGSWQLSASPIEQASVWSDYEATHKITRDRRTVRVYIAGRGATADRNRLANAAKLEFEALRTFDHPGVLHAFELDECELGHAIVFEDTKGTIRLDHFLMTQGASLDFSTRIGLLRQICEAVSASHDRGIAHRGLVPSSVLIAQPAANMPVVKLRNWHWRLRTDAGEHAAVQTFGGETVSNLSDRFGEWTETDRTYLAPELRAVGEPGGIAADIFSVGALAHLIFSGRPPATTLEELDGILRRVGHLAVSQYVNGASYGLERFIARASAASPLRRAATARELIETLDRMQDQVESPGPVTISGPEDLVKGTVLDGDITVVRRLGSGGTAVGFEVSKGGIAHVLKVARTADLNGRLSAEANALRRLKHDHVVSVVTELQVGSSAGLLLWPFGQETLHDYLRREGPPQFEFLERWGSQLLAAVEHLEDRGVSHRDIKPGNLAVTDRGQKQAKQIVLFDFSLAALAAENLDAGTPGYIDPFLGDGNRRQWDRAAERYAAAVTLYELATGTRPVWGDGSTFPQLLPNTPLPNLDSDLLPVEVRSSLLTFFQKALHRDALKRFDSATAMREGWQKALSGTSITVTTSLDGEHAQSLSAALDTAKSRAGVATIVTTLPLSPRALNALGRLGVDTVGDLLKRSPHALRWLRGVGRNSQQELADFYQLAKTRFPDIEVTIRALDQAPDDEPATPSQPRKSAKRRALKILSADASLEELAKSLIETGREVESRSMEAVAEYLGLESPKESVERHANRGSSTAAAEAHGLTRAAVYIALDGATKRWSTVPAFQRAQSVVSEILTAREGLATINEVAAGLGTRMPSDGIASEAERGVAAFAVALAVAEAERRAEEAGRPRFDLQRQARNLFVVANGLPTSAAAFAGRLGARADTLVQSDDGVLPPPSACLAALRQLARPEGLTEISNERLLSLAAASATVACVNGRGEFYPRGLAAARALKLAQGALAGLGQFDISTRRRTFTADELRDRVAQRYSEAERLPDPPACLPLVRQVLGDEVDYDAGTSRFLVRTAETLTVQSGSSPNYTVVEGRVGPQPTGGEAETQRTRAFETELRAALQDRRVVVLGVQPRSFPKAGPLIARAFNLRTVSLDELFVQGLKSQAAERGISLERIYEADRLWPAGPDVARFKAVLDTVRRDSVEPRLLAADAPIAVSDFGLLFRYGMGDVYTELRNACGLGNHPGAVCILPADGAAQTLSLDGQQFPEFDPSRILRVPSAWIKAEGA